MSSKETYRRDNWWGSGDHEVETVADEHRESGTDWHRSTRREDKAEHVAHDQLRGVAPALCAVTCDDPDRVPVELTDSQYYPTGEGNRKHLRAVRANPEDGYLSGGESTAVVLDGVPTERFLKLIDTWLTHCVETGIIGHELAQDLRRDAQSLKQGTDKRDEDIVGILVRDVLAGERGIS